MCIYLDVSLYFIQFCFFPFTAIFNELLLSLLLKNFTFCRHLGEKLRTLRDDVSLEEGKFCWEDVCAGRMGSCSSLCFPTACFLLDEFSATLLSCISGSEEKNQVARNQNESLFL